MSGVHDRRPPLVMLPGLGGTAALFRPQLARLEQRFRPIVHPFPHGHPATMAALVEGVRERIERTVGGQQVFLFGESFGGALAQCVALAAPDRLRGLILLNTFPYISRRAGLALLRLLLELTPWWIVLRSPALFGFVLHGRRTPAAIRREVARSCAPGDGPDFRTRLAILHRFDVRDRLAEIALPTLVLAADRDRLLDSVGAAREMAARISGARVEILKDRGHICMMDPGFDLCESIDAWLASEST